VALRLSMTPRRLNSLRSTSPLARCHTFPSPRSKSPVRVAIPPVSIMTAEPAGPGATEHANHHFPKHKWQRLDAVYCIKCGATPGVSNSCPVDHHFPEHRWQPLEAVFCAKFGATPGISSGCSADHRFHDHKWVAIGRAST